MSIENKDSLLPSGLYYKWMSIYIWTLFLNNKENEERNEDSLLPPGLCYILMIIYNMNFVPEQQRKWSFINNYSSPLNLQ